MHSTTCLLGGCRVTFHVSIVYEFCGKACDCHMPLFFICWSLEKVPWFWVLIVSFQLNFPFRMLLWESAAEKTPKFYPMGSFILVFLTKCLLKCPKPRKPPLPWNFLFGCMHSAIILFVKNSVLNFWQFSEYICLDNCSVICTLTLCYVLHQRHSEFWHIQNYLFRYIQEYSALLRHIWDCIIFQ